MAENEETETETERRGSSVPVEHRREQRRESRSNQTLAKFVDRLTARTGLPADQAMRALGSVLCVLEQRIMGDEAKDLNSQLPAKVREIVVQCEVHQGRPRKFDGAEFVQLVSQHLDEQSRGSAEQIIRSVLACVRESISEGEANQVRDQLPADIRAYWVAEA